jgi:hypothetical protein
MAPRLRARGMPGPLTPPVAMRPYRHGDMSRSAQPHTHATRTVHERARSAGDATRWSSHAYSITHAHERSRDTTAVCHIHRIRVQHARVACCLNRLEPPRRPGRGSTPHPAPYAYGALVPSCLRGRRFALCHLGATSLRFLGRFRRVEARLPTFDHLARHAVDSAFDATVDDRAA